MTNALLAVLMLVSSGRASVPQGSAPAFAAADGAAAYAIVTDPGATTGRVVIRRLGLDGGMLWEDRWGEGRNESPVGASVSEWGGLSVAGDQDAACFAAHWTSRGARLWTQTLSYGSGCHARAVLVDGQGDTYALATTTQGQAFDATVWKIDRRGQVLWNYRPGRAESHYAFGLSMAAAGDGVTVTTAVSGPTGWVYDTFDLDGSGRPR